MTMIDVMTKPASELGITDDMQAFMRFAWAIGMSIVERERSLDELIAEFNEKQKEESRNPIEKTEVQKVIKQLSGKGGKPC